MSRIFLVFNRQRGTRIDIRMLRRIGRTLLQDLLERDSFDLAVYIVGESRMTEINETHLGHAGSTDVITFDYADPLPGTPLHGELFLCVDEAKLQATRYRTTWQSELIRYLVHGVLHLSGFDDLKPAQRRLMKRREDRLLAALSVQFNLSKLAGAAPGPTRGSLRPAPLPSTLRP